MGHHRSRAQVLAGQGHRQLDHLKEGEEKFKWLKRDSMQPLRRSGHRDGVRRDRPGRHLEQKDRAIARRAYKIFTEAIGLRPQAILFSTRTSSPLARASKSTTATPSTSSRRHGWIKQNCCRAAKVCGGVSNISFSFRGNNPDARSDAFSFLIPRDQGRAWTMGIVNPGMLSVYQQIPRDLLELVEDVLLNRRPDATERLVSFAERSKRPTKRWSRTMVGASGAVDERLSHALVKGITDFIESGRGGGALEVR